MRDYGGGLLGIVLLVAVIYAAVKIFQSGAGAGEKVLWIVLIIVLPVIGLIAWFFFGPK
jgi:Phospholipase_D-nuclease N-terminal